MNPLTTALPANFIPDDSPASSSPLLAPPTVIQAAEPAPDATPATTKPKGKNVKISLAIPSHRPPGFLPSQIAAQSITAQRAFTLLCANPGRSMRSIAKEVGVCVSTLTALAKAGRWSLHLGQFIAKNAESLNVAAKEEAHRSRLELLDSNLMRQAVLDAAVKALIVTDEHGNPRLRKGAKIRDVASFNSAVANHVKTTQILTGEDAANRRSAAAAGAPKIVINTRDMMPEPIPVVAHVVSSADPPE